MITHTTKATGEKHAAVKDRGPVCVHCLRRCGTVAVSVARIGGLAVCSKPTDDTRPDCYRMVMVKFHVLRDCKICAPAAAP